MHAIKTVDDLWELIAYVVLYAPNDFPYLDFLDDDEQMNFELGFKQLRQGVEIAYPDDFHPEKREGLYTLLEQSYTAYEMSDRVKGVQLLQEFEENIFKQQDSCEAVNDS